MNKPTRCDVCFTVHPTTLTSYQRNGNHWSKTYSYSLTTSGACFQTKFIPKWSSYLTRRQAQIRQNDSKSARKSAYLQWNMQLRDPPVKVAVLGCTGSVGQRFIQLLEGHPWFQVVALGASTRSAGQKYKDVCRWKQSTPLPSYAKDLIIRDCKTSNFSEVDVVFSGLSNQVAGDIEEEFASAGKAVFSNAKNHRMDPDVPILIPAVNADHVGLIDYQRKKRGWKNGFIVTNANCSTTAMCLGLKPILDTFGIESLLVTTMQAISGSGYPGLPSMDIIDNVIPLIGGEEPKMESEPLKIYGQLREGNINPASITISAMCNRVHVLDGHTECISLKLKQKATPEQVIAAIESFPSFTRSLGLPSSPERDVQYIDSPDRPQPRLDRQIGNGFTVSVGRARPCPVLDIKLVLLGHNTIVGAAGGSIINAELCLSKGIISLKESSVNAFATLTS